MRIAVASDHAGLELKEHVARTLRDAGHQVSDVGTHSADPVDYPDCAVAGCREVLAGRAERAILFCGSGVGMSIAANKLPGIRAGNVQDHYSAHQGVEHDDMNVLVLGGRTLGIAVAEELAAAFIGARFSGDARHARRLAKVLDIESSPGRFSVASAAVASAAACAPGRASAAGA